MAERVKRPSSIQGGLPLKTVFYLNINDFHLYYTINLQPLSLDNLHDVPVAHLDGTGDVHAQVLAVLAVQVAEG